jgi:hypothetical protein
MSGLSVFFRLVCGFFSRTMKKIIYSLTGLLCVFCAALNADHHQATANLAGKWDASASVNETESRDSSWTFRKKDGKWTASMVNEDGVKQEMDRVKVDGKTLIIEFDFERDGTEAIIGAKADLQKDGNLIGKWYVRSEDGAEQMSNDWKAVRSLAPVFDGKWDVVAETDENDIEHVLIVEKAGSGFSATASSEAGDMAYSGVKVAKNGVKMEIPYGGGTVKISAKLSAARKLLGEWKFYDEFNEELAKGNWIASKGKAQK